MAKTIFTKYMKNISLPKVSIIMPSFNQVNYIESAVLSIINQTYLNKEIIIIDGGSTDGTIKILEKCKSNFSILISEKDEGQYFAANKGLSLATGEIIFYLNSDDKFYCNEIIEATVNHFIKNPGIDVTFGSNIYIDEYDNYLYYRRSMPFFSKNLLRIWDFIHHPTVAFRRKVLNNCKFNTNLNYAADYDFLLQLSNFYSFASLNRVITASRWHIHSKDNKTISSQESFKNEQKFISNKIFTSRLGYFLQKLLYNLLRLYSFPFMILKYKNLSENKSFAYCAINQIFGLRLLEISKKFDHRKNYESL